MKDILTQLNPVFDHRNRLGKPHCSTIEVKIANHLSADILSQAIGILENIGWRIEKAAVQDPGARESSYFIHRRPPQTLVN